MSSFTSAQASSQIINEGLALAQRWIAAGPKQLLIDGKWVPARSDRTIQSINPATEEVLAEIAEGDAADVDAAVAAARRALAKYLGRGARRTGPTPISTTAIMQA